jgi:hypothetical protein
MSPNNKNNTGGTCGRAVLTCGEAARAAETHVLAHAITMLGFILVLFVMSAPQLWPQLFAAQN